MCGVEVSLLQEATIAVCMCASCVCYKLIDLPGLFSWFREFYVMILHLVSVHLLHVYFFKLCVCVF